MRDVHRPIAEHFLAPEIAHVELLRRQALAAHEPSSVDLIQAEGHRRGHEFHVTPSSEEFDHHLQTYQSFLRWSALAVAHALAILALMAFFLVR